MIDKGAVPDGEGGFEDAAVYSLASPDAAPHFLGETLTNDSDGAPFATATGLLAFVSDTVIHASRGMGSRWKCALRVR